jgi:hypothetical protein
LGSEKKVKPWQRCTLKMLAGIVVSVLLVSVGFLLFLRFFIFQNPFNDQRFNQSLWAAYSGSTDPSNPRGQMYEDLTKQNLKKGMSKQDILALLGEPDFSKEDTVFKYNLGAWSGFRIDYDSLDIEFDQDGKVKAFYRVQH